MKVKKRVLAFLLMLTMVLTFMPAMAFADDGTKLPSKIEYNGNTEYTPSGVDGETSDYFWGFNTPGNEVTVTWDDNTTTKYVRNDSDYVDGNGAIGEIYWEALGGGKFSVNFYVDRGDDGGKTVSAEVQGKAVEALSYAGPTLEYEVDETSGEIYGYASEEQEGAAITVKYTDGSSRKAVCQKWGTNTSGGDTYDEFGYFFEGETPIVQKDSSGYNYPTNQVDFEFMWKDATEANGVPVKYLGVTSNFPISKKVYPKPVSLEFVPADGFTPTSMIGQTWLSEYILEGKGNKLVVTWDNGKKEEYAYGTYKDRGGYTSECFGYIDEDGWLQSLYIDFGTPRIKKGDNTITGTTEMWVEGHDIVELPVKVNVRGSGYLAYVKHVAYTYSGKTVKPKVAVYVANDSGKMTKLKASKYTYKAKTGKNVGEYIIDVKLKNKKDKAKYGSLIRGYYSIVPKAPSGVKVKAGSKQLTVSWKKQSGVSGFFVDVSEYKDFRYVVNEYKKLSKKATKTVVKNLEPGKSYYVRVYAVQKGKYTYYDEKGKKHTGKGTFSSKEVVKKSKVK